MDAHRRVLLDAITEWRADKCGDDDVYVWWGKVRSENRQGPLPHLAEVLALDAEILGEGEGEMHLYLTDYRSLYGGIVDLPLIVYRDDDAQYFDDRVQEELLEGQCWVQWDAERAGL